MQNTRIRQAYWEQQLPSRIDFCMEKLPILWKSNYSYWLQLIYTKYVHPCRISVLCYFWQLKPHSFSCREEKEIIITPHQKKKSLFYEFWRWLCQYFQKYMTCRTILRTIFFFFFFLRKREFFRQCTSVLERSTIAVLSTFFYWDKEQLLLMSNSYIKKN